MVGFDDSRPEGAANVIKELPMRPLALLPLLALTPAQAQVLDAGPGGFHVRHPMLITAKPASSTRPWARSAGGGSRNTASPAIRPI